MIRNLKDTTLKNTEQDWLKTNLAKFSRMLQGQRDLLTVGRLMLSELAPVVIGAARRASTSLERRRETTAACVLLASYAYQQHEALGDALRARRGAVGQCAVENAARSC